MKQYLLTIIIQDGDFEYDKISIFNWGGDPTDEQGILRNYTGDNTLSSEKCNGKYKSKSDYRIYSLFNMKEIDINDLPIIKKYFPTLYQ